MRLEWKYQKAEKDVLYQLFFRAQSRVQIFPQETGGASGLLLGGMEREVYRAGSWMAESRRVGSGLELLLKQPGSGTLRIAGWSGAADIIIRILRQPMEERAFQKVTSLVIGPEYVRLETEDGQQAPPEKRAAEVPASGQDAGAKDPEPEAREARAAGGRRMPPQGGGAELAALRAAQEAQEARKEAQAAKAQAQAMEQAAAQLRTQLEAAQRRSAGLESAAGAQLEEAVKALAPLRGQLGADLEARLEEAQAAEASLEELRSQVEAARGRIASAERTRSDLQAELAALQRLETIRSLDCGQARKDLESLRIQLEADGYSLTLLQQEPFLKGASFPEQLEDIRTRLEQAEAQLGAAVSLREQINNRVQNAILCGDGTIPLAQELGGGAHGRGRTETQNP